MGIGRLYATVTTNTDIHSYTHRHTRTQRDRKTDRHTNTYVCTYVHRYRQETAPVCMNAVYCIVWHTRKNKECPQSILTQIHTQRQREIVCHCLATVHTDMPSYTHVSRHRQETTPVCMNAVYCIVWRTYSVYSYRKSHQHHILICAYCSRQV